MQFSDIHDSDAWLKVIEFANKSSIAIKVFSTDTLVEEIKLVVMMRDVPEYGDLTVLIASFGTFRQPKF